MAEPSWSCDAGHHTLQLETSLARPGGPADVAAIVAALDGDARREAGITHLSDHDLAQRLVRMLSPRGWQEEVLVLEREGAILGVAFLRQSGERGGRASYGGWSPKPNRGPTAAEAAMLTDLAHAHLGCPYLVLYTPKDDPGRLDGARAAGFVDEQPDVRKGRYHHEDGSSLELVQVAHSVPVRPRLLRACPRR